MDPIQQPRPEEVEQCEPYLHQQLALTKPKVIVALGRISAQALLKTDEPLGKLRGSVHQYGPDNIPLVATYHPADPIKPFDAITYMLILHCFRPSSCNMFLNLYRSGV